MSSIAKPGLYTDFAYGIVGTTYSSADVAITNPVHPYYTTVSTTISYIPTYQCVPLNKVTQFVGAETAILYDGFDWNAVTDNLKITGARHGRWSASRPVTTGVTNVLFLDGHAVPILREQMPLSSIQYCGTRAQMNPAGPRIVFATRQK